MVSSWFSFVPRISPNDSRVHNQLSDTPLVFFIAVPWSPLGYWCGAVLLTRCSPLHCLTRRLPDILHVYRMGSSLTIEIENCFSDISFRLRSEHTCDNFEPFSILGDGHCLHRSVSKGIFKSDQYWSLIKFGTLLSLKININKLIKVRSLYHFPSLFLDFFEKCMNKLKANLEGVVQLQFNYKAILSEALSDFTSCLQVNWMENPVVQTDF